MEFTVAEAAALFGNMAGAIFACFIVALFLYGAVWKLEDSNTSTSIGPLLEFTKDFLSSSLWFLGIVAAALALVFIVLLAIANM